MSKTYRKFRTERQKERNHKWKNFKVKCKIIKEIEDEEYSKEELEENPEEDYIQKEVFKLQQENRTHKSI
jgi:hypothetical protein